MGGWEYILVYYFKVCSGWKELIRVGVGCIGHLAELNLFYFMMLFTKILIFVFYLWYTALCIEITTPIS